MGIRSVTNETKGCFDSTANSLTILHLTGKLNKKTTVTTCHRIQIRNSPNMFPCLGYQSSRYSASLAVHSGREGSCLQRILRKSVSIFPS